MTIRVREENHEVKHVLIELSEAVSTFSVEVEPGLIYHYDEQLNPTQIEVKDTALIEPFLKGLQEVLKDPNVKIIRKAA